jgi:hypothetical protein
MTRKLASKIRRKISQSPDLELDLEAQSEDEGTRCCLPCTFRSPFFIKRLEKKGLLGAV